MVSGCESICLEVSGGGQKRGQGRDPDIPRPLGRQSYKDEDSMSPWACRPLLFLKAGAAGTGAADPPVSPLLACVLAVVVSAGAPDSPRIFTPPHPALTQDVGPAGACCGSCDTCHCPGGQGKALAPRGDRSWRKMPRGCVGACGTGAGLAEHVNGAPRSVSVTVGV